MRRRWWPRKWSGWPRRSRKARCPTATTPAPCSCAAWCCCPTTSSACRAATRTSRSSCCRCSTTCARRAARRGCRRACCSRPTCSARCPATWRLPLSPTIPFLCATRAPSRCWPSCVRPWPAGPRAARPPTPGPWLARLTRCWAMSKSSRPGACSGWPPRSPGPRPMARWNPVRPCARPSPASSASRDACSRTTVSASRARKPRSSRRDSCSTTPHTPAPTILR